MGHSKKVVIISISSDIGKAIATRRLNQGELVVGTYRSACHDLSCLKKAGVEVVPADMANATSIDIACNKINAITESWDELIVAPGALEPIGNFEQIDFDAWSMSFNVNFINQMRAVHNLLNTRNKGANILFFAGGGTNSSANRFSAYTASKIALIKMTELLDSEIDDAKFSIIGPGWIKTKIHDQTISAKANAGSAYLATVQRFNDSKFGSMEDLLDCIDWIFSQPKDIVGGRNISSQHDRWKSDLAIILASNPSAGKLRRHANNQLSTQ